MAVNRHFITEIKNNPKALEALKKLRDYEGTVTLLCHYVDEKHCHRTIVKDLGVYTELK